MIELNGHIVKPTIFPDGTSQVWQLPDKVLEDCMTYEVTWWFEHEAELMHLAQLRELLWYNGRPAALKMPYMPYARQDKAVNNNETFAMSVFNAFLNKMQWNYICAYDTHCDVEQYYPNIHNIKPDFSWMDDDYDTVIFPDDGACRRYADQLQMIPNVVVGHKIRDQKTGFITSYELNAEVNCHALVVDDLCDGGATFHMLAQSLPNATLDLYVTHGIFSKGFGQLSNDYLVIITTNSYFGSDVYSYNIREFGDKQALLATMSMSVDHERRYKEMYDMVQAGHLTILPI